jgi:hypothetical protein
MKAASASPKHSRPLPSHLDEPSSGLARPPARSKSTLKELRMMGKTISLQPHPHRTADCCPIGIERASSCFTALSKPSIARSAEPPHRSPLASSSRCSSQRPKSPRRQMNHRSCTLEMTATKLTSTSPPTSHRRLRSPQLEKEPTLEDVFMMVTKAL